VDNAKFRRQVVPGDRLRLEVRLGRARSRLAKARATAFVDEQPVAEADLLLGIEPGASYIHPTAVVHPRARVGAGTTIGTYCTIGPEVVIGERCRIGASVVIDGWTEIGSGTRVYPMGSIGLAPQDLKYKGERTRLTIAGQHVPKFVTVNRGTLGRRIDVDWRQEPVRLCSCPRCHIGDSTIFGSSTTRVHHRRGLRHVSAYSGVHPFCRVESHASSAASRW
jgi:UDP-N-acetylglucosamine acyltransferase